MKSKIIIGIHGLENKPAKEILEKWWKAAIEEGLRREGNLEKLPLIKIAYWADLLYEKPLDETITDKKNALYLDDKYIPSSQSKNPEIPKYRKRAIDFVKKNLDKVFLKKDLTPKNSFVSDAILRKYFKDLESYYTGNFEDDFSPATEARKIIRERLSKELKKYSGCEIMLIAHSMGTIISYDVLTQIVPEVPIDTFITLGSPLGLPVVKSNIAKESNLCMDGRSTFPVPPGIIRNWYNFADLQDSVAIHYDIADDFTENANGVKVTDIIISNDYTNENKERNPHNSFGYLRTPEISKVISEFITRIEKTRVQKFMEMVKTKLFRKKV